MSFAAPWLRNDNSHEMPHDVWASLSEVGRKVCRSIVAPADGPPLDHTLTPDFGIAWSEGYSITPERIQAARSAAVGGSGTQYHPSPTAEAAAGEAVPAKHHDVEKNDVITSAWDDLDVEDDSIYNRLSKAGPKL